MLLGSSRGLLDNFSFLLKNLKINKQKYQGVKEFHMLARIGYNCKKIMVFNPFKLEVTYYHPPRVNK